MQEREIKVSTVLAAALWALALGLVGFGIMTSHNGVPGLGVLCGLAATVIQIRGSLREHRDCIRDAFEMGRDYEKSLSRIH